MSTPTESISGIQDKGDVRVIPMSRRADGTIRKERKVRPGYTPPEDVAKYTNRVLDAIRPASSISSLATPPVNSSSSSSSTPKTKSQIKNEKRKAKRKEEGPSETNQSKLEREDATKPSTDATPTTAIADTTTATAVAEFAPVDPEKKLRALNKKLRQAEQLKERQEKGEELLPEQLEKISKMDELQALIAELAL
ncbi:hypothetical protein BGZ80_004781 [Entomortierella chlamydospora]|uniref:WIBG Mago-binding domain-containing protein n=1 Tax=Entomortierella chlamydospora TaxID=101097 RepID=A0A9P6N4C3_9FUNG|nr:hypothetical protein BGZ79_008771 [Entomortierella chlamydospora]KAG0024267.1 hypothetical protein BGZ80_004781 [Entomortierella chlamydospora]